MHHWERAARKIFPSGGPLPPRALSGPWLDFAVAVFDVLFIYAIPGTPECPLVLDACGELLAALKTRDARAHAFVRREFIRFVRELDPDAPAREWPEHLEGMDPFPYLRVMFEQTEARAARGCEEGPNPCEVLEALHGSAMREELDPGRSAAPGETGHPAPASADPASAGPASASPASASPASASPASASPADLT